MNQKVKPRMAPLPVEHSPELKEQFPGDAARG
jgi:hypothetical protein